METRLVMPLSTCKACAPFYSVFGDRVECVCVVACGAVVVWSPDQASHGHEPMSLLPISTLSLVRISSV